MKAFNLAKFKKTNETKDWADLIHQDGHYLRIAKGPLSAIQRKQLENLAVHQNVQHFDEGGVAQPEMQQKQAMPAEQLPQQMAPTPPQSSNLIASNLQTKIPAIQEEKAAQIGLANQIAAEGREESKAIQGTLDQVNKLPTQQDLINNNKESSDKLFQAYKDQKLDPDHYWKDHSKIAAGIGVLLSSLGQAVGGPNVQNGALDAIHEGINRDIDAQKNAQGQSHNLWKMNREALGDDLSATLATQNQLYTGLKYKIEKAAADSKGPVALAQANIANAKLDQLIGQNNFQLSLLSPTSNNMDPASSLQFLTNDKNKEFAIPATKEIASAKHIASTYPAIIDAAMQSWEDTKPGIKAGRAAIPFLGQPTPGQAAQSQLLGNTVVAETDSGRQAEFENVRHNIVNGITDTDSDKGSKLRTLVNYLASKSRVSPASKALGLDLTKFPSTNTTEQAIISYIAKKYPDKLPYVLNDAVTPQKPNVEYVKKTYSMPDENGKLVQRAYRVPKDSSVAGR